MTPMTHCRSCPMQVTPTSRKGLVSVFRFRYTDNKTLNPLYIRAFGDFSVPSVLLSKQKLFQMIVKTVSTSQSGACSEAQPGSRRACKKSHISVHSSACGWGSWSHDLPFVQVRPFLASYDWSWLISGQSDTQTTGVVLTAINRGSECEQTYMLRILALEPDLAPMTGILLTTTEEPLAIRPSLSVNSRGVRWRQQVLDGLLQRDRHGGENVSAAFHSSATMKQWYTTWLLEYKQLQFLSAEKMFHVHHGSCGLKFWYILDILGLNLQFNHFHLTLDTYGSC